jgi:uncharacterized membrane protein YeiH
VLYSIPAALGAGAIFAASEAGEYAAGIGVAVATAVFALRIAALKFGWRAPRPRPADD